MKSKHYPMFILDIKLDETNNTGLSENQTKTTTEI